MSSETGGMMDLTDDETRGLPIASGPFSTGYDEALLTRIARAMRFSTAATPREDRSDVWTAIEARHSDFRDLLASEKFGDADRLLGSMFASPLTYGFEQHEAVYRLRVINEKARHQIGVMSFDRMLRLAMAVRAIPVQNPEQGDFSSFLRKSPDTLLEMIEEKIGFEIIAPTFLGGLFGLATRRGILNDRLLAALYVALRVRELVPDRKARICEIGGGAGYVGYWCYHLGYSDFTIIDLPVSSAVQAYLLAKNIGADKVALAGEGDSAMVNVLGTEDFPSGRYDLVLNVDSLPEMSSAIMRLYIGRIAKASDLFLSINQEAMAARSGPDDRQECVGDVIEDVGGLARLMRAPFWLRDGYVEEVYRTIRSVSSN